MRSSFILCVLLTVANLLNAQNYHVSDRTFIGYSEHVYQEFGISVELPGKYRDINQYGELYDISDDNGRSIKFISGPILESKNRACLLLYPWSPFYVSSKLIEHAKITAQINAAMNNEDNPKPVNANNNRFPRGQITMEIKSALGGFDYLGRPLNDTASVDFNERVSIIAGRKAGLMFNADTVYIYDLPFPGGHYGKYKYCTGVVLCKRDRATTIMKLFFTPKGYRNRSKYIFRLHHQIWYEED